jgi:hypothetical protein
MISYPTISAARRAVIWQIQLASVPAIMYIYDTIASVPGY